MGPPARLASFPCGNSYVQGTDCSNGLPEEGELDLLEAERPRSTVVAKVWGPFPHDHFPLGQSHFVNFPLHPIPTWLPN